MSRSITPEQIIAWDEPDPRVWVRESIALRKTAYPASRELSYTYAYQHRAEVDNRLKMAGVRIAAYLNWVFDPHADDTRTVAPGRR